jgi:glucose/mannose transport system permease protein
MFQRGELAKGSAAAVMLLGSLAFVLVPYGIYQKWKQHKAGAHV